MRTGWRPPSVLLLVLGLLLGLVPLSVSVVLEDPATAQAARIPAPIGPPPDCSGDDNPNIGADCHALPSEGISVSATGIFGEGGSINFVTTMGMAPCESTSNSTDCYWSVDAPEISGCVYLHEGDPTDLRSCGFSYTNLYSSGTELPSSRDRFTYESGTATPFNGSPQTLRCGGGFSTVYIYGGDQRTDFRWAQRGPKLLNCNIDINMPRPDNLRGPSFVRVQADVRICGSDNSRSYCGTPSRTARASAWVPVDGDLAPAARFTAEPAGGGGLSYFFANQSIPFHDGATTYEWDFGDGTTSTAVSPSHTFASTGTKFVRLTMRSSDGQTLSATERIDLVPPDLAVTVFNPNAEFGPGKTGNRLNVGDEMTVRVKVRATDGVGHLDDVAPVDALLDLPDQFEFVQPDPPVDPFDPPTAPPRRFDPDDAAEYDVRIRAVSAGRATIRSTWNGDDAAGDPSGPWSGSFETSVTGLQVEILPDPDSFKRDDTDGDGDIDDDDNHVEVEVKVTNVSQAPITDITKGELLVTSKVEDDPLPQFLLVASPVDDPSTPDVDEGAFGDLDPGESHSITWTYRADEAVHVDLSMLVTGAQAGATVTSLGEGTVKAFDNVVLEAKIAPAANASYASGKPIRIDGEFTNVTDRPEAEEELTISFAAVPVFSAASAERPLNGAGGYFGQGGATPAGIEVFELAPGESVSLRSVVASLEMPVPTAFVVEYKIVASIKEDDGNGGVSWTPLDALEIDIVEKDGYSAEHAIGLAKVVPEVEDTNFISCDQDTQWAVGFVGCKLVRGVETAARGLGSLVKLGYDFHVAKNQAYLYVLGRSFSFLAGNDEARLAIATEIVGELIEMKNTGYAILQSFSTEQLALLVPRMLDSAYERLHFAWCRWTPEQLREDPQPCANSVVGFVGELAEVAGENIDMVLEALVAARGLAKVSLAIAGESNAARRQLDLLQAAEDAANRRAYQRVIDEKGHRALPGERALTAGFDVTDIPTLWRDAYGLAKEQLQALQQLTKTYSVNITFRSRAPRSIELIESGRALPKPQGIKTKGVNEIDVDYLGYDSKYADLVVHMEPPIPVIADKEAREAAAKAFAEQAIANGKKPKPEIGTPEYDDLVKQIQERVLTRHKEWVELTPYYRNAIKVVDGAPVGVKVDFDGAFNGVDGNALRYEPNRPIEFKRVANGANGRKVFEVRLQTRDGLSFKDVTGDVDFLAILKPDGTVLGANGDPAELAKRLEIYELMRKEPISMQHGESFTIAVGEKTRTKFVKDGANAQGGETTLTVTPDERVVTTYFDDGLSTLDIGPLTLAEAGEFGRGVAFFRGVFSELRSPGRSWTRAVLEEVRRQERLIQATLAPLFDLSILERLVSELAGEVRDEFDRDGAVVRPDGAGGLERYDADGDETRSSRSAPSPRQAASPEFDDLDAIVGEIAAAGFDVDPAGALGGRWVPVTVAEVLADGPLGLAPFGFLRDGAVSGDSELLISSRTQMQASADSPWFEVGDTVIIDPGGQDEELVTVASVDPFRLAAPLSNTHNAGTTFVLAVSPPPAAPVDPVDPPTGVGSVLPVVPARLVDTRPGEVTVDGRVAAVGRVGAGEVLRVPVWGRGGVPESATSVVVNTVAVAPLGSGFVTLFPCDGDVPSTSNVNYRERTVAVNNAVVKLSARGELCVFSAAASHVVMDVTAYAEGDEALVPKRLAESRLGERTDDGRQAGFGRVAAGSVTEVEVAGRGGVRSDAAAVAVNVTVVNPSGPGFVTLFPCDEEMPLASNLNFGAGAVRPNAAIVALSGEGSLCVFSSAETDLIVDVTASFADVPAFSALNPARLLETRPGEATVDGVSAGAGRLAAGSVTRVEVAGRGGVPSGASVVAVNTTVVAPSGPGFVTSFPCDAEMPLASSGNYVAGDVVANSGVVKLSAAGELCVFTSAETHLIVDVNAAWAA